MRQESLVDPPGTRWTPNQHSGVGALVLAGSSGRIDSARAELLARHGSIAEALQWFGGPGQHEGPWEIPLELFLGRVAHLARDCDRVLVLGTSFGAEAALLTGVHSPQVGAVVAFAPSDVVWTGITPGGLRTSHWTLMGTPLAHVPFDDSWQPSTEPPAFVDFYRTCREQFPEAVARASIPVEQIPEIVLVAGGDDRVWPSMLHAEAIVARRRRHGLSTILVSEEAAGHRTLLPGEPTVIDGMSMERGGTEDADRALGERAWAHILALL